MPRADPVTIAAFPSSTPTWVFSLFSLEFAGGDDDVACGDVSGHASLGAVLASALPPVEQHHLLQAREMQALSFAVHIPLVCFGIAFPAMVMFVEWLYLRTGDELYRTIARRWTRVMVALFAVGVITGTILSFEMGLLWPNFTATFGSVFGLGFAIEGFSFFLEAIFLGIYVYGWDRLSPRLHFLCSIPIIVASVPFVAFGGGVLMTLPYALLAPMMPDSEHGALTGFYSLSRGLGTMLGPILAGVAIQLLKSPLASTHGYAAMWAIWSRGYSDNYNLELQKLLRQNGPRTKLVGLDSLVRRATDFAEAYNQRAILYYRLGKFRKAIADCERVMRLNPHHFGAAAGMAQCYLKLNRPRAALRSFRVALAINPNLDDVEETIKAIEDVLGE